ncbi:gamma-parvin isoform X4 [Oryctolagus cuniculus]|uniref:gamma-parvin isoform X4 n=1 Tax=Oryctolagus cuniculus TaxID=9986 RepID=UPI003879298D
MARPLASRGFVGTARDGGSGSRGGSERPPLPPSPAARGPGSCPCSERPSHRGRDSLFGKQPGTAEHRVNSEPCSNHDSFCPPNPPGRVRERMEPESSRGLQQLPTEGELPPGEKKKYLAPASRKDPRFEELQQVLMEWINATLLPEHIVARSLEEDLFDGLILHHLFQKLAALRLEVEEMALTSASQQRKLAVVLDAVNRSLQVEERQVPWSVEAIFSKDLLATLHLLVALAKRFQPDLPLPANVHVEVITIESTRTGLKSETSVEQLTECGADKDGPPVCRWGHLALADRTAARLLPAPEGILPHAQFSCGKAAQRDPGPGAAEGPRPPAAAGQPRSSLLWPGKAVEDGPSPWTPAPTWETRKKLLAPGFGSVQLQPLWPSGE